MKRKEVKKAETPKRVARKSTLKPLGVMAYKARTRQQMLQELAAGEEPLDAMLGAGTGQVYTDNKEGVRPEHDIRTDRAELALDAIERVRQERAQAEKATAPETTPE